MAMAPGLYPCSLCTFHALRHCCLLLACAALHGCCSYNGSQAITLGMDSICPMAIFPGPTPPPRCRTAPCHLPSIPGPSVKFNIGSGSPVQHVAYGGSQRLRSLLGCSPPVYNEHSPTSAAAAHLRCARVLLQRPKECRGSCIHAVFAICGSYWTCGTGLHVCMAVALAPPSHFVPPPSTLVLCPHPVLHPDCGGPSLLCLT